MEAPEEKPATEPEVNAEPALEPTCEEQKTPQRGGWKKPLIAGALTLALGVGGFFGVNAFNEWRADQEVKAAAQAAADAAAAQENRPAVKLVENPIDFAALQNQNHDIYAWISIPGTKVDHAICQSVEDDNHYLRRDEYDQPAEYGALFTQSRNKFDFSDPVTVVYGHNASNDGYFATLHYFENEDFFNAYDTVNVYTPKHILTYKIVSAYQYDDRHILNSFNFVNPEVRQSYFNSVLNPETMLRQVREGVELTPDSKLLQLSTCMNTYLISNTRYLVNAVLVDDQPTY